MRAACGLVLLSTAACYRGPEIWIVPLAEMDAELLLGGQDYAGLDSDYVVSLSERARGHCSVLSPRDTIVTINGRRGRFQPGGSESRIDSICYPPSFWPEDDYSGNRPSGQVTLEIDDKTAHWTFVLWDPFERVDAAVISHDRDDAVVPGDTVLLKISPPSVYTNLQLVSSSSNLDLDFTEGNGLTVSGDEVSFVMPPLNDNTVTTGSLMTLRMLGTRTMRVDRCDAPRGCQAMKDFNDLVNFEFAPAPPPP